MTTLQALLTFPHFTGFPRQHFGKEDKSKAGPQRGDITAGASAVRGAEKESVPT
jgi:hypothetical protein